MTKKIDLRLRQKKKKALVDIMPTFCEINGCINKKGKRKRAHYGKPGQGATRCAVHKLEGMVYACKSLMCISCKTKRASFGIADCNKATHCGDCKSNEMIDIKNKKCCLCYKRRATFGVKGTKIATHCGKCAPTELVDVLSKLCTICTETQPVYGLIGTSTCLYCSKCVKTLPNSSDMEDIMNRNKKCINCNQVRPSYALRGTTKATHCGNCREPLTMFDVKACKEHGKQNCKPCKELKICPYCVDKKIHDDFTITDPNSSEPVAVCGNCYYRRLLDELHTVPKNQIRAVINRVASNRNAKEIYIVRDLLDQLEDEATFELQVYTSICEDSSTKPRTRWYFTDMQTYRNSQLLIIIEIDENQHNTQGYSVDCDATRMQNINDKYEGFRVIFLRLNPDSFTDNNNKKHSSMFIRDSEGLIVPSKHYKKRINQFVQVFRAVSAGSVIGIEPDPLNLLGAVYVNYDYGHPAIQLAIKAWGVKNVATIL